MHTQGNHRSCRVPSQRSPGDWTLCNDNNDDYNDNDDDDSDGDIDNDDDDDDWLLIIVNQWLMMAMMTDNQ